MFNLFDIWPKWTASNHLSDENNLLLICFLPCWYEMDDVLVLQLFNQIDLLSDSGPVLFRQPSQIDNIPCDFSPCFKVNSFVNDLVCSTSKLVIESLEPSLGWLFEYDWSWCTQRLFFLRETWIIFFFLNNLLPRLILLFFLFFF